MLHQVFTDVLDIDGGRPQAEPAEKVALLGEANAHLEVRNDEGGSDTMADGTGASVLLECIRTVLVRTGGISRVSESRISTPCVQSGSDGRCRLSTLRRSNRPVRCRVASSE